MSARAASRLSVLPLGRGRLVLVPGGRCTFVAAAQLPVAAATAAAAAVHAALPEGGRW
jgi:hypothetical protein